MIKKLKRGFTLVELIIVIAIIAILAVTAFLLLTKWLSKSRDAGRSANLANMEKSLQIYFTDKSTLPQPDNYTLVYSSGTTNVVGYQGYFGDSVKDSLGNIDKAPKDDDTFFTYYVNGDLNKYQLAGFMENALAYNSNVVSAVDYRSRFVNVRGDKLGLLTDINKAPLQSLGLTGLDISTGNTIYIAYLDNSTSITGTGKVLAGLAYRQDIKSLKDGLIAYYSFDSISGTGLNDSSGNGNVGNISGSVIQTGGVSGKGFYFNGSTAVLFNKAFLNNKSEYTRAGWIYGRNIPNLQIFYSEGGPSKTLYIVGVNSNIQRNSWNYYYNPGTWRIGPIFGSGNININGWNYLTIVGKNLDINAGTVDYYINGQKIGTYNSQKEYMDPTITKSYGALGGNVGAFFGGTQTPNYYTGSMDEVRIYDHALSENEVKALYYRPSN